MRSERKATGIVAGAGVPHAPQFWTMPSTESPEEVATARASMQEVGRRLQALDPEVLILVGNDHSENFYRECVPSFAIHTGPRPGGSVAGRTYAYTGAPKIAYDLVAQLQRQGFDPAYTAHATLSYAYGIPLEFCSIDPDLPIIPIFVNAYFPPQPTPDRCWAFGQALNDALKILGVRAVIIASGGMSHYPGTGRYSEPDYFTDEQMLTALRSGRTRSMLELDLLDLDRTGNDELLPWLVAGGALGQRVPDVTEYVPSWHHTYTTVGWTEEVHPDEPALYYPSPGKAEDLCDALHALRYDVKGACELFLTDIERFSEHFHLNQAESSAISTMVPAPLLELGAHPLLLTGATRSLIARGFVVGEPVSK